MKPRLIILSDLWGKEKSDWVSGYVDVLKHKFEIQYYDCCELGGIDKTIFTEASIHNQFVNGGIDRAVANLLELEKGAISILGFSVGGTIAWKSSLKGLNVYKLCCISSTRLRHENQIPSTVVKLFYGKNDTNRPSATWLESHTLDFEIIKNKDHNFYVDKENVALLCDRILK
jgi:hypothetical protein